MANFEKKVDKEMEVKVNESSSLKLQVNQGDKEDNPKFDLRKFVDTESYSGPTRSGIRIPPSKIDEVIGKLQELNKLAEENDI